MEQKPWVNPFGKIVNFSTFWTSCFYSLEGCFFVLEYCKRHFAGLYCQKKKVGKWASFGPKSWVNPFVKMLVIRPFELLFFYSLERCFLFVEYHQTRFSVIFFAEIKIWRIGNFWPHIWTNPFGKEPFFWLF